MRKFLISGFSLLAVTSIAASTAPRYSGAEHEAIGDKVGLRISSTEEPVQHSSLTLTNGLSLTYGDLLALGDFYGIEAEPISQGVTPEDRELQFVNVFKQIDVDPAALSEAVKITDVIHKEMAYVQTAVSEGLSAKEAYDRISMDSERQFNCITGGFCDEKIWWAKEGRSLKLASTNFDHFGEAAWLAYEAGHRVAMNEAAMAGKNGDVSQLNRAYAMNALASHYLADRFAAGHIRGPRFELSKYVTPTTFGNMLMKFMHDEENAGLNVHDVSGQQWRAFGDGYYFEDSNAVNREHIAAAMQQSADEIFAAYQVGSVVESQNVYNRLPIPDELNGICNKDIAPLFYWDQARQVLLRRDDVENTNNCSYTSFWFAWSTLIELALDKGLPISLQGELAKSSNATTALRAGIISDKSVQEYIKSR